MTDPAVIVGDCVEVMRGMPAESVDACVCDPPYGLGFMGKDWDRIAAEESRPPSAELAAAEGRDAYPRTGKGPAAVAFDGRAFQAWSEVWAREAYRVLKPGGFLVAAGGSRTWHRLTAGIEDAGFEIRDTVTWHFGSGFPKSLDVSKALRALPACACDVAGEVGAVDPGLPAGAVGAEAGAVALAGLAADGAARVGPEAGSGSSRAGADVQRGVEHVVGEPAPVVLGSPAVAGLAARDEIGPDIGCVEVDPEALRDDVMSNGRRAAAVEADGAVEDAGADGGPTDALVLPLAAAPCGVTGTREASAVGNGHAGARAVDAGRDVAAELGAALDAGEALGWHDLKCDACGRVRRDRVPDGMGTALKPATEFFVVARKPLSGTVAATVLEYGTGALNIAGCRIGAEPGDYAHPGNDNRSGPRQKYNDYAANGRQVPPNPGGRWLANVMLVHADGCRRVGERRVKGSHDQGKGTGRVGHADAYSGRWPDMDATAAYADADGMETVEAWECVDGCPVKALDEQTGHLNGAGNLGGTPRRKPGTSGIYGKWNDDEMPASYGDSGSASRFFLTAQHQPEPRFLYAAKASSAERNAGLDGFEPGDRVFMGSGGRTLIDGQWVETHSEPRPRANVHPTVKPVAVMRWLVRLVTPPGGLVLDPFAGSGTTGCAAALEGVRFVGIEKDPEYARIAEARVAWWRAHPDGVEIVERLASEREQARVRDAGQDALF